ncbi:hypothetical protein DL771_002314 [Monosporascus sp. 5C6A]|nr:hypothetical protein DL771_002314 [Monosporascus sp. 5C6A]
MAQLSSPDPFQRPDTLFKWNNIDTSSMFPAPDLDNGIVDAGVKELCIMCDKKCSEADAVKCIVCGSLYCSVVCRLEDREFHRRLCPALSIPLPQSKDGQPTGLFQLMFWPQKESCPKIYCCKQPAMELQVLKALHRYAGLPEEVNLDELRMKTLDVNPAMPWRRLGHGLRMYSLALKSVPAHLRQWLRVNHSIMTLSRPGALRVQYGPVIVAAFAKQGEGDEARFQLEDVTMRDFRSFIDFYQFGRFNPCISASDRYPLSTYNVGRCRAVRLNCVVDVKRFSYFFKKMGDTKGMPSFEPVWATTKSLNTPRLPWYYAHKVGLHWMIQQCSTNADEGETADWVRMINSIFPSNKLSYMPNNGLADRTVPGSLLVVHKKGKDISVTHVLALALFLMVHPSDELITREKFQEYWEKRFKPSGLRQFANIDLAEDETKRSPHEIEESDM